MSARFHPVTGVSVPWGSRQICEQKKAPDLSSRANRNRRHLIEPLVVRAVAAAFAARVVPARVVPARVAGATSRLAAARLAGGRGLRVSLLLRDDIARELVRLGGFGFGFGLGLGFGFGFGLGLALGFGLQVELVRLRAGHKRCLGAHARVLLHRANER